MRKRGSPVSGHKPNFGDGESVLTLLYEAYAEWNKMEQGTIKEDFNELYRLMNSMILLEMDKIIYLGCTLCGIMRRLALLRELRLGFD